MDESELDAICARLAKRVAQEGARGLGKKWRCPSGLREEIVAYAVICRETGEVLNGAGHLGIDVTAYLHRSNDLNSGPPELAGSSDRIGARSDDSDDSLFEIIATG